MSKLVTLLAMPLFAMTVILSLTYAVGDAFKYEFKNKKAAYIFSIVIAVIAGVVGDIAYLLFPPIYETEDILIDGEFISRITLSFIHFVVLLFMLRGKFWKRFLALFLSNEIIGSLIHIFEDLQYQLIDIFNWENESNKKIAALIIEFTTMVFVLLFLFVIARIRRKNDNTPLSLPVMGIITVFMLLTNSLIADEFNSPIVIGADIAKPILLMLILVTVGLFFFLRSTSKERDGLKKLNKINEELVESQTKYFEATAKADSEIRAMRHDMKNNIQVLMLLLEQGDYDKMREYLDEMGENLTSTDISAHTGDTIADTIIADKTAKAEALGLTLDCSGKISGVEISPVDMCKMLANLLDNAIEAASAPELSELEDSLKVIDLRFKKTENFLMISVTNPSAKAPKTEHGKIVTSKKDSKNHGFGIHNIENAVAAYNGELTVTCDEKQYGFLFRADIIIPIESKV